MRPRVSPNQRLSQSIRLHKQEQETGKARIRKNVWDNWYGYIGRKQVAQFFNTPYETQQQQAERWLKEMSKNGSQ